jgi:HD-GYP domain-containing protein (c-di-GMP phosphodiesterase class II)
VVTKMIGVNELRLGMFIHDINASWIEHSFWRSRFKLDNERDLRRIQQSGIRELTIDTDLGVDTIAVTAAPEASVSAPAPPVAAQTATSERCTDGVAAPAQARNHSEDREAAIADAAELYRRSVPKVASMFGQVRLGKAVDTIALGQLVHEISDSVLHNSGALISVMGLKRSDEYTYMHSMAVCALMLSQARQLGLEGEELQQVGLAGMLHDLGKACIPMEILNKPGKLTEAEFSLVKTHPVRGHALLDEAGSAGAVVLDVCLHHHEKIDGSGYPFGLVSEKISRFAKMAAVCDVYDAITSDRPYKAGWDPGEALRQMAQWKGHFDSVALQALVKAVGIYPVGSLVRLASGRLAVVVEQNPATLLAPRVRTVYDLAAAKRIEPQEIDLAERNCPDKVTAWEPPERWALGDLNAVCGLPSP